MKSVVSWRGKCWSGDEGILFFITNPEELFDLKYVHITLRFYKLKIEKESWEMIEPRKIGPVINA